jgi:hypothetical protein
MSWNGYTTAFAVSAGLFAVAAVIAGLLFGKQGEPAGGRRRARHGRLTPRRPGRR